VEIVASLSQGSTAAAQCGLFTHKSVPVIFETPCVSSYHVTSVKIQEGSEMKSSEIVVPLGCYVG